MAEEKQAAITTIYDETFRKLQEGDIVKGKVVAVNQKEVVIDIGFKSEGFVPIEEFHNPQDISVGKEIEVLIESMEDDEGHLVRRGFCARLKLILEKHALNLL